MNVIYKEESAYILESLKRSRSSENIHYTVLEHYERISDRISQIIEENNLNIACERSCCYCCYLRVEVRAHEVFAILRFLQEKCTEQEIEALKGKLHSTVDAIYGLAREEHFAKNVECSLLLNGECFGYPVRPSMCRKHHSQDAGLCRYSFENPHDLSLPPVGHPLLIQSTRSAVFGFRDASERAGFDSTLYELNSALLAALEHPECGKKWRQGKSAFPQSAEAKPE